MASLPLVPPGKPIQTFRIPKFQKMDVLPKAYSNRLAPTSHFLWNHRSPATVPSSPHHIFSFCWSSILPFMFISTEPSLFPQNHCMQGWIKSDGAASQGSRCPVLDCSDIGNKMLKWPQELVRTIVSNLEMSRACHITFFFLSLSMKKRGHSYTHYYR